MDNLLAVEKFCKVIVVDITQGDEILLCFMLDHLRNDVIDLSCGTKEHFAFTILDVFLDIEGNSLCDTEIFHVIGDVDTHLFAKLEEIVDSMT